MRVGAEPDRSNACNLAARVNGPSCTFGPLLRSTAERSLSAPQSILWRLCCAGGDRLLRRDGVAALPYRGNSVPRPQGRPCADDDVARASSVRFIEMLHLPCSTAVSRLSTLRDRLGGGSATVATNVRSAFCERWYAALRSGGSLPIESHSQPQTLFVRAFGWVTWFTVDSVSH